MNPIQVAVIAAVIAAFLIAMIVLARKNKKEPGWLPAGCTKDKDGTIQCRASR